MGVKRDSLDAIFSDVIRLAYGRCQYDGCEVLYEHGLDCAHFYSRRYAITRTHPDNCLALCRGHHWQIDQQPLEKVALWRTILGPTRLDELQIRFRQQGRYRKKDKKEMRAHYRQEYERISAMRRDGHQGQIEVIPWD